MFRGKAFVRQLGRSARSRVAINSQKIDVKSTLTSYVTEVSMPNCLLNSIEIIHFIF